MAGSKTAYLSQKVLDHLLGGAAFTPPATVYLCLSVSAFDPAQTGTSLIEVAATDYARVALANDDTTWSSAASGAPAEKHNLNELAFAAATSAWGTPQSAYLADAATAGNLLFGSDITNPQAVNTGDVPKIPAGAFVFNED